MRPDDLADAAGTELGPALAHGLEDAVRAEDHNVATLQPDSHLVVLDGWK